MCVSSQRSSRAAELRYLFKISWRTIPRCGAAALLFLFAGMYLLFSTHTLYRDFRAQQSIPFETTAMASAGSVALEELQQIEGINGVSPVCRMDAELIVKENTISCEIMGVLPDYPDLTFLQGSIFPLRSNMPYLIVNEAVVSALGNAIQCGDAVAIRTGDRKQTAVLCGIFENGSPEPRVYMSYETGISMLSCAAGGELVVTLSGRGVLDSAARELQRYGVLLEYEQGEDVQTALLRQRIGYSALLSICFLISAAALLYERCRHELSVSADERAAVRSSGITALYAIFPLRILLATVLSAVAAYLFAFF